MLTGALVLLGWALDAELLKVMRPGLTAMKANTALGILAAAVGLFLIPKGPGARWRLPLAALFGFVASVLGALALAEHEFGLSLGLDELLAADPNTASPPYPKRMSPAVAGALLATGSAVLLLAGAARRPAPLRQRRACACAAHLLAFVPASVAYLGLAGYAYRAEGLDRFGAFTVVALHTVLSFALLAPAILLTSPGLSWRRAFVNRPVAHGVFARLLPSSLLGPFLAGLLVIWGIRTKIYGPLFGPALFALIAASAWVGLSWIAALAVRKAEGKLIASEARLARSEAFLRSVLDASTDCLKVVDLEGRVEFVNANGLRLMEISDLGDVRDREWTSLWPEGARAWVREAITAAREGRESRFEAFRPTPKGMLKWWDVAVAPVRDRTGRIARIVSVSRDVTEAQQAAERDARLAAIVASSTDAMISFDADGRIRSWNGAAERLFGYTEAEALGASAGLLVPPDTPDGDPSGVFQRAMRGELVHEHETVRAAKDGRRIPVTISAARMFTRNGRVIGVSAIFRDIEARKRAEASLRDNETRLRLATEAGRIGVFDWDLRTDELRWDERVRSFWALPFDAPVTIETFYAGLHPEDRPGVEAVLTASLDPASGGEYQAEYRVIGATDGIERTIAARGRTGFESGRAVRMVGTAVDVTALRRAERVLARDKAELESLVEERTRDLHEAQRRLAHAERMEALGQLAGGIAHDFNNVLQAIQGAAALIERRPSDAEGVRRRARIVFEAAGRGSAITRRLLAFSRRGDLRAEPVDAAALLADLREILTHTLGAGIGVRVSAPEALPELLADKGQLETVLVNLATNARDAMEGKGSLILSAAADRIPDGRDARRAPEGLKPGRYIRLGVSDTGSGMDAATLARASEPFFTTKPQGKGTGLGLAIARGFAEQSGGALHIESAPGQGTTVSLWFPLAPGARGTQIGSATAPPALGRPGVRLLVVDDDALVREVTAEQLEAAGYAVLSADGGAAALALLDAGERVDLIISDLSMPGMDGLELLREAQERRPGLLAILVTGFATNAAEIALGGALSGAFSLLRKPVAVQQLAERIEMLLEGAAERSEG